MKVLIAAMSVLACIMLASLCVFTGFYQARPELTELQAVSGVTLFLFAGFLCFIEGINGG